MVGQQIYQSVYSKSALILGRLIITYSEQGIFAYNFMKIAAPRKIFDVIQTKPKPKPKDYEEIYHMLAEELNNPPPVKNPWFCAEPGRSHSPKPEKYKGSPRITDLLEANTQYDVVKMAGIFFKRCK